MNSATIEVPPYGDQNGLPCGTENLEDEWEATPPSKSPTLISILMY